MKKTIYEIYSVPIIYVRKVEFLYLNIDTKKLDEAFKKLGILFMFQRVFIPRMKKFFETFIKSVYN